MQLFLTQVPGVLHCPTPVPPKLLYNIIIADASEIRLDVKELEQAVHTALLHVDTNNLQKWKTNI